MNANKALFLDRDGVINIDHGYVYQPEQFQFIAGVFKACKRFTDAGFKLIIITNQSGIGRGYYTEHDFEQLTLWMKAQFAEHDIPVSGVYFCPHHPKKALPEYLQRCDCRKPEPGMLLQAITEHNIDPKHSIMVGDKLSDMLAAEKAHIATRILVRSGQQFEQKTAQHAHHVYNSLADLPSDLINN
ncbi:D-glycero-beta-D-manno-heptose 1,7-bisphosphate 7-phosphatase [Pseudoalteromonas mariniglutinosa]|uniref:D-glycero-beta-D-manno-heptose 1,7-bisphosphate 7-phosphatase n=1 Tax=Pseudoalteromonas mariniglutinosa TaxID=206042 RepID=UPI00384A6530